VLQLAAEPEPAAFGQRSLHDGIGFEYFQAADHAHVRQKAAIRADRRVDVEPIARPDGKVIRAMSRRRVHDARALVERHVLAQHGQRITIVERVPELDALDGASFECRKLTAERPARGFRHAARERGGHDDGAILVFERAVLEVRMKRDGQIRRNRPGCRRPDQDRNVFARECRHTAAQLAGISGREREFDIDRRRRVLFVFHFRVSQRGAVAQTPVDGLLAFVDQPAFDEDAKRADDRRLEVGRHRQVRRGPIAKDAEPLEIVALRVDEFLRKRAAGATELHRRAVLVGRAFVLFHVQFDRQSVAIPTRHVRRIESRHRPGFDHQVFQNLVQRMADVNLAIGIRRPVMHDELRGARAGGADLPVQTSRVPARDGGRLGSRQVRLHREVGPWQVQRVFPVTHVQTKSSFYN
jgi:hypothetical protein